MLTVHDFAEVTINYLDKPIEDVIKMAKRHNNPKRDFLFVNTILGKHIAVQGRDALMMHRALGDKVYELFKEKGWENKKVLLVGFAETATALAQNIMFYSLKFKEKFPLNIVGYTQTTREELPSNQYTNIAFEEEHSHATSQKLYFDKELDYDVVLFVEDEITTGNTILNFISQFEKHQSGKDYAVASILNWQNDKDAKTFSEKGVEVAFLVRGKMKTELPSFSIKEGKEYDLYQDEVNYKANLSLRNNPRLPMTVEEFSEYVTFGDNKDKEFSKLISLKDSKKKTLIIGTEENMFVPIFFAIIIDADVKATTRSPIESSLENGYPISSRLKLNSAYESGRVTYLYDMDLGDYEQFVIFVEEESPVFENELTKFLSTYGEVKVVCQKGLYSEK
jgi:hypothetical protein